MSTPQRQDSSSPGSVTPKFLTLPALDTFEPLTKGTNLPSVPYKPSPAPSTKADDDEEEDEDAKSNIASTSTAATTVDHVDTPPQSPVSPTLSPTRPGSMRRFLSRVSLNSTYDRDAYGQPPMSPTGSVMSGMSTAPSTATMTKKSWWRRKEKTVVQPQSIAAAMGQQLPGTPAAATVSARTVTPPPKLPDFQAPVTTFDDDLFKNIK